MKALVLILMTCVLFSCNKSIQTDLPEYDTEIAVEMYLEDMKRLRCLVTETLPYSSTTINKMINNAQVIFSDGVKNDTLQHVEIYDYETGRHYNYASMRFFVFDSSKTYTLKVTDSLNREINASVNISLPRVSIDSVVYLESPELKNKFSVGFSFPDPAGISNYYRIIIGEGVNNYQSEHTDFLLSDVAFDGKRYSFSTGADYERNDTITVRLYSLMKDHYDYLQSASNARTANYNPFMQPVTVKSNITGGQGIFTAIRYDERKLVIK